jgi:hypothetical protein
MRDRFLHDICVKKVVIRPMGLRLLYFKRRGWTMKLLIRMAVCLGWLTVFLLGPAAANAGVSKKAQTDFEKTLLGKDVKALLDMPAYKDGLDLYVDHKVDKRLDERGIDLKDLSKFLKEKGCGSRTG